MPLNKDKVKALELAVDTGAGTGRRPGDVINMAVDFYNYFMEVPDEKNSGTESEKEGEKGASKTS